MSLGGTLKYSWRKRRRSALVCGCAFAASVALAVSSWRVRSSTRLQGGGGRPSRLRGGAVANLDGRGGVVDAEEDEASWLGRSGRAHGAVNLWTAENWFAAQTARTTRKTKLER